MTSVNPFETDSRPTPSEIGNFLSTRTGGEMVNLMQSLRDPRAQAALTTALLENEQVIPVVSGCVTNPEKAKKALNAFVGFRCYYILVPVFKQWPMKMLSNLLSTMWNADPYKPLWSLMAKAWSIIRDTIGKEQAPLEEFFRIICPRLNIPSPETYLQHQGWLFCIDKNGAPALKRVPSYAAKSLAPGVVAAAISVENIISYCQSMGYAQGHTFDSNLTSSTFLGHSGGKTSTAITTKQNARAEERRIAERNKRRAKKLIARETGFTAKFQEAYDRASDLGGFEHPKDGRAIHQFGSDKGHADDQFYKSLGSFLSTHTVATDGGATQHTGDTYAQHTEDSCDQHTDDTYAQHTEDSFDQHMEDSFDEYAKDFAASMNEDAYYPTQGGRSPGMMDSSPFQAGADGSLCLLPSPNYN